MLIDNTSLNVVLIGDWNKLYIQPNWIAENVYCQKEIELGVIGQGTEFSITYRCENIVISPSQNQMIFAALDMNNLTIERLSLIINNFLQKATTPVLTAYGLNCEFSEINSSQFAEVVDTISDSSNIIESGFEILSTKISRSLSKDGVILNLESSQIENKTVMHFNEHHGISKNEMPVIDANMINSFITTTKNLIIAFGYDIEEE